MRAVPDEPVEPWEPPRYSVDADGKVLGASPGTPNNWGRWGPADQRGTANLLTPERVAAAARLVRTGRQFALGLPFGRGQPNPGTRDAPVHVMNRSMADVVVGDAQLDIESCDDSLFMALQVSTQLDALAHFGHDHVLFNGYWAGLVTGRSGARRLGVHHYAGGIAGRGVLLDAARVGAIDPFEGTIDAALLDATARQHGVEVGAGDIVLVRTGWLGTWLAEPALRVRRRSAGLTIDTIEWLAERDVAMVAADNRAVEAIPGPAHLPALPFHIAALRDLGLLVGELFDLDELAGDCDADGVYELMFVAQPLPVVGGAGSPLNPVALK